MSRKYNFVILKTGSSKEQSCDICYMPILARTKATGKLTLESKVYYSHEHCIGKFMLKYNLSESSELEEKEEEKEEKKPAIAYEPPEEIPYRSTGEYLSYSLVVRHGGSTTNQDVINEAITMFEQWLRGYKMTRGAVTISVISLTEPN